MRWTTEKGRILFRDVLRFFRIDNGERGWFCLFRGTSINGATSTLSMAGILKVASVGQPNILSFSYKPAKEKRGDMEFVSGNVAIREHVENGKDLHLFASVRKAFVRSIGHMICTGYEMRPGTDREGRPRHIIMFELTPLSAFAMDDSRDAGDLDMGQTDQVSLDVLRQRALGDARPFATAVERKVALRGGSESDQALRPPTGWWSM